MILEIIFILNFVVAFVVARSIQIADRAAGGHYYMIFEDSKFLSWFAAILMFVGMISLFAIIIWGFIYLKWFIVVGTFVFCVFFASSYGIGGKFPFHKVTHLLLLIISISLNAGLWIYKIFKF
tara:strand:- start:938 stop:1306 length:369 start_codon:yes stop_codon:yes gene_type:complete